MSQQRSTNRSTLGRPLARAVAAFGVAAAALSAACADVSTAPTNASPSASLSPSTLVRSKGGPGTTSTVGRVNAFAQPVTVSYHIDPRESGRIEIPAAGLRIDVPKGAVSEPVTISVTALPGNVVAYEFQPHGLVFRRPLEVRQDLRAVDLPGQRDLEIAYFADKGQLDVAGGKARVNEFLASNFDFSGSEVRFDIEHFSGYMVSWGRSRYY